MLSLLNLLLVRLTSPHSFDHHGLSKEICGHVRGSCETFDKNWLVWKVRDTIQPIHACTQIEPLGIFVARRLKLWHARMEGGRSGKASEAPPGAAKLLTFGTPTNNNNNKKAETTVGSKFWPQPYLSCCCRKLCALCLLLSLLLPFPVFSFN